MREVYFDNGSTSFPKAPGLGEIVGRHLDTAGYNISRGSYSGAYSIEGSVLELRSKLCEFFGCSDIRNVAFTPGATWGINIVLRGLLKKGDHIVTTSMEHNAVVRPLHSLDGIEVTKVQCDIDGNMHAKDFESVIKTNTKAIVMTHGSNVNGTITPVEEVGKICKSKGIFLIVDAAQTAGSIDVNMKRMNIDALVIPAHKSMLGPQGIGAVLVTDAFGKALDPFAYGGTGSASDSEEMPDFMPDKLQPGTLNIPGIIGFKHAVEFIETVGLEEIKEKKMHLTKIFLNEALNMENVRVVGRKDLENRCSLVSLDFLEDDNAEIAYILEKEYGILTRCGMHCAPWAHKSFCTFPQGTVRFSLGYFNEENEVKYVIDSINSILKGE